MNKYLAKGYPEYLDGYPESMIVNAMRSVFSVLEHNGVDYSNMNGTEMSDAARAYSAPCSHKWEKTASGEKRCAKCGGIQS